MAPLEKIQLIVLSGTEVEEGKCFLLGDGKRWIMLDCGLSQNGEEPDFSKLKDLSGELIAVVITHGHMDHAGGLPAFAFWCKKNGFAIPPIYSTKVTKEICKILLNKMVDDWFREKIFNEKWIVLDYDVPEHRVIHEISPNILLSFVDANHILGSAGVFLQWRDLKILYSSDAVAGEKRFPMHFDLWEHLNFDVLLIDGTYGEEVKEKFDNKCFRKAMDKFVKLARKTLNSGGRVLVPVIFPNNIEEIMITIAKALKKHRLPEVPCYSIGSQNALFALINELLQVKTFDPKLQEYRKAVNLILGTFTFVPFVGGEKDTEFRKILTNSSPMVIVVSNGKLLKEGPAGQLLTALLKEEKSKIFLFSYRDEDTSAIPLVDNIDELERFCEEFDISQKEVREKVIQIPFRNHLLPTVVLSIVKKRKPKTVVILYGSKEAKMHFSNLLKKYTQVVIPQKGKKILFDKEGKIIPEKGEERKVEEPTILTVGKRTFEEIKAWFRERVPDLSENIARIPPPLFDFDVNLEGTNWLGYYRMKAVRLNPSVSEELYKPLLAHLLTHYLVDSLIGEEKQILGFAGKTFFEGSAEYVAFKIAGEAWMDITNIGDDGIEYPPEQNPFVEGFRNLLLIEKKYSEQKVADLILKGNDEEYRKLVEDLKTGVVEVAPPEEKVEVVGISVQPAVGEAAKPAPAPKEVEAKLLEVKVPTKKRRLKLLLIIGIVVLILLAYFFIFSPSEILLGPTAPEAFSISGLPETVAPGNYTFAISGEVTDAPALVKLSFIVAATNHSFTNPNAVVLLLNGSSLPPTQVVPDLRDVNDDGYIDWVGEIIWEFYEAKEVTGTGKLILKGKFVEATVTFSYEFLPLPQVEITFSVEGLPKEEDFPILTVDDSLLYSSDLPKTFEWTFGEEHEIAWDEEIMVGWGFGERYGLVKCEGIFSGASGTFHVPSVGGNITAFYARQVLVTVNIHGAGKVTATIENESFEVTDEFWVNINSTVTFTAIPDANSTFVSWEINYEDCYENPLSLKVTEPLTIYASFNQLYTVRFEAILPEGVEGTEPILIVDGETYTVKQLPLSFVWEESSQHTFEWLSPVNCKEEGVRLAWSSCEGLSYWIQETIYIWGDGYIRAVYKEEFKVVINEPEHGVLSIAPGEYWYEEGELLDIIATPDYGYEFAYWEVNGEIISDDNSLHLQISEPTEITAVFNPQS